MSLNICVPIIVNREEIEAFKVLIDRLDPDTFQDQPIYLKLHNLLEDAQRRLELSRERLEPQLRYPSGAPRPETEAPKVKPNLQELDL